MENPQLAYVPEESVQEMYQAGLIVEADQGGLLSGPLMQHGGIPSMMKTSTGYLAMPLVEGHMFILNPKAAKRFKPILDGLNDLPGDVAASPLALLNTPVNQMPVLDCYLLNHKYAQYTNSKVLLFNEDAPCYLVNRFTTYRHLDLLKWMNAEEPLHPVEPAPAPAPALSWWRKFFRRG